MDGGNAVVFYMGNKKPQVFLLEVFQFKYRKACI